jgi:hypothetical protein
MPLGFGLSGAAAGAADEMTDLIARRQIEQYRQQVLAQQEAREAARASEAERGFGLRERQIDLAEEASTAEARRRRNEEAEIVRLLSGPRLNPQQFAALEDTPFGADVIEEKTIAARPVEGAPSLLGPSGGVGGPSAGFGLGVGPSEPTGYFTRPPTPEERQTALTRERRRRMLGDPDIPDPVRQHLQWGGPPSGLRASDFEPKPSPEEAHQRALELARARVPPQPTGLSLSARIDLVQKSQTEVDNHLDDRIEAGDLTPDGAAEIRPEMVRNHLEETLRLAGVTGGAAGVSAETVAPELTVIQPDGVPFTFTTDAQGTAYQKRERYFEFLATMDLEPNVPTTEAAPEGVGTVSLPVPPTPGLETPTGPRAQRIASSVEARKALEAMQDIPTTAAERAIHRERMGNRWGPRTGGLRPRGIAIPPN